MDKALILNIFHSISDELKLIELNAVIDIYGGAAIAVSINDFRTSNDIDAVIVEGDYSSITRIVNKVGAKYSLPENYFNEAIRSIVTDDMQNIKSDYSNLNLEYLTIRIPPPKQLLAMKLYAARDEKDIEDAVMLAGVCKITSRYELEQALKQYIKPESIKERSRRRGSYNAVYRMIEAVANRIKPDSAVPGGEVTSNAE